MNKLGKIHIHISILGTIAAIIVANLFNFGPQVEAAVVGVTCSGSASVPTIVIEADLAGDDVTFSGSGYCEIDQPINAASVVVLAGVTLTHPAEDVDGITINTTGNMTIENGAILSADGKGCGGGVAKFNGKGPDTGNGNVCTISNSGYGGGSIQGGGGGGHGGAGGTAAIGGVAGTTYDTSIAPALLGSGGGGAGSDIAGAGGGLIILNVKGTLTLDGTLTADGEEGNAPAFTQGSGGGSGGSIYVSVNTLTCSGSGSCDSNPTITTTGGLAGNSANAYYGGSGGGGMVRFGYVTIASIANTSYFSTLANTVTSAGASASGGGSGSDGTLSKATISAPSAPSITAPTSGQTRLDLNPTATTSAYSGDANHVWTDWQISTDSGFTDIVWSSTDDTGNLLNIVANVINGIFAGTRLGEIDLADGTTHYIRARHTNAAGNSPWATILDFIVDYAPTTSSVTGVSTTDGSGEVTVQFTIDDTDNDDQLQALVEYNIGGGWTKATISETLADTTSTYGTPDVENLNTYQVGNAGGYIQSSSGANTISVIWDSQTDEPTADLSTAQIRITPFDNEAVGLATVSSNFTVDNAAPFGMASFNSLATTSSSITWSWTAPTDSNFDHYEIWYGENQTDVENRTGTATQWDAGDDSNLSTISTATTTITGLSEDTTYYAKIWAIDSYTNEATVSTATANNNGRPTLSGATATQAIDGSGDVTLQFIVDDADDDDTIQVGVQFDTGSGFGKMLALSESLADITSTAPATPNVENDNTYQIGNASGYIQSSSGPNTISVKWATLLETGGSAFDTNAAQIRLTPYDGIEMGATLDVSGVTLDNVDPTGLAGLILSGSSESIISSWTSATDSNFDHYELWYGETQSDVDNRIGTATEWDDNDDAALVTSTTATTTITGLTSGTAYFVKIWAVDLYGNESTIVSSSIQAGDPPEGATGGSQSPGTNAGVCEGIDFYNISPVENALLTTLGEIKFSSSSIQADSPMISVNGESLDVSIHRQDDGTYVMTADASNVNLVTTNENGDYEATVILYARKTLTCEELHVYVVNILRPVEIIEETSAPQGATGVNGGSAQVGDIGDTTTTQGDAPTASEVPSSTTTQGTTIDDGMISEEFPFMANGITTRGHMIEIIMRNAGYTVDMNARSSFPDMQGDPSDPYVALAEKLGIVEGYADGLFRPEQLMTKAEALKVLLFKERIRIPHDTTKNYFDTQSYAWYISIVNFAALNSIGEPAQQGYFIPDRLITNKEFLELNKMVEDFVRANPDLVQPTSEYAPRLNLIPEKIILGANFLKEKESLKRIIDYFFEKSEFHIIHDYLNLKITLPHA